MINYLDTTERNIITFVIKDLIIFKFMLMAIFYIVLNNLKYFKFMYNFGIYK